MYFFVRSIIFFGHARDSVRRRWSRKHAGVRPVTWIGLDEKKIKNKKKATKSTEVFHRLIDCFRPYGIFVHRDGSFFDSFPGSLRIFHSVMTAGRIIIRIWNSKLFDRFRRSVRVGGQSTGCRFDRLYGIRITSVRTCVSVSRAYPLIVLTNS